MIINKINSLHVVLASASPRRRDLLSAMGINFVIEPAEVDESYFKSTAKEIVEEIALKKLHSLNHKIISSESLVITADTLVWWNGGVLGKPSNRMEALQTIRNLSGASHEVHTGVAVRYGDQIRCFSECTIVTFAPLSYEEIEYYVDTFHPLDKAGSYGIQEWIGMIAVQRVNGSYENVIGLPTARLYQVLKEMLT